MKNIREKLKTVLEFKDYVSLRGREYIIASRLNNYNGERYDFYINTIEFDEEYVYIYIEESTSYDCPERKEIELTIDQLEMDNDDWAKYLDNIKEGFRLKDEKISKRIKAEELREKKELFEKLKKELGEL